MKTAQFRWGSSPREGCVRGKKLGLREDTSFTFSPATPQFTANGLCAQQAVMKVATDCQAAKPNDEPKPSGASNITAHSKTGQTPLGVWCHHRRIDHTPARLAIGLLKPAVGLPSRWGTGAPVPSESCKFLSFPSLIPSVIKSILPSVSSVRPCPSFAKPRFGFRPSLFLTRLLQVSLPWSRLSLSPFLVFRPAT